MRVAITLARAAGAGGDVPVGAVVVVGDEIVGCGGNRTLAATDPSAHAEIVALREAALRLGAARLPGSTLYVTLEPCLMCLGAMIHARIDRLVFAAADPKVRALEILDSIPPDRPGLNHRFAVTGGVLADEAASLLRSFFRERR